MITAAVVAVVAREWGAVPDDLTVPAWAVPAYLATLVLYFFARAGRFWFLVRPIGPVGFRELLAVAFAGFLWILLLPWRLGEFVRPQLLAQVSRDRSTADSSPTHASLPRDPLAANSSDLDTVSTPRDLDLAAPEHTDDLLPRVASPSPARPAISFAQALGAVAVERVVDGLIVCAMFFVAVAAIPDAPALPGLYAACVAAATLFGGVLFVLLALAVWPNFAGAVLRATVGRLVPRLADRLAGLARGVGSGLVALPSPRWLILFTLATLVYWAANALGMWVLAAGCGLDLAPAEAVAVLAVLNLTLLVPGPPAHVGTFQLGVLTGLALFLPPAAVADRGVVYAFYLYVCQVGMIAVLGIVASLRLRWGLRDTLSHVRTALRT